MKHRIIAISRQFGSGGRTIGKECAAKLGIACYDQELIEMLSEKSGFSASHVAELNEETARGGILPGRAERVERSLQYALWQKQRDVILELAEKELKEFKEAYPKFATEMQMLLNKRGIVL